jgi:hypothetical protein
MARKRASANLHHKPLQAREPRARLTLRDSPLLIVPVTGLTPLTPEAQFVMMAPSVHLTFIQESEQTEVAFGEGDCLRVGRIHLAV